MPLTHRGHKPARSHGHPERLRRWKARPELERLEARCLLSATYRTIDGTGNNLDHPDWGAAGTDLVRVASAAYGDGVSAMAGADRPSPREISNAVAAQAGVIFNNRNMSDWVWQWGQFLDHDLDLTPQPGDPAEHANVPVPAGDPFFDPQGTGTQVIGFDRSVYDPATGTGPDNPRQQPNVLTSYIDGSQVYGSDPVRADALRTHVGGRLKTSPGDMLPFNSTQYFDVPLPNANNGPFPDDQLYAAGDVRANENIGLTAVQTLFVREHNRLAGQLARQHPDWDDEQLYQQARKIVGAEIEAITYNEFLPALMGHYAPSVHGRYDPTVDAAVTTEFSTAGFRVGHTLLSNQILRVQNDGQPDPRGPISLADSFFNPPLLTDSTDLRNILKGLASQRAEEIDNQLVDGVRNFLFGPPGSGGFDLASLNIQRGRDHGLSDYNTTREAFGMQRVASFADITSNLGLQQALEQEYGSVDNIDLWVGALAEDHLPGASIGPLLTTIFTDQFTRLRDGDRFFFEFDPSFSRFEVFQLEHMTLADVIRRNTGVTNLQRDVFVMPGRRDGGEGGAPGSGGGDDTESFSYLATLTDLTPNGGAISPVSLSVAVGGSALPPASDAAPAMPVTSSVAGLQPAQQAVGSAVDDLMSLPDPFFGGGNLFAN